MQYEVTRTARGKTTVIAIGSRQTMYAAIDRLRRSTRGGRVSGRGKKKYTVAYALRPREGT